MYKPTIRINICKELFRSLSLSHRWLKDSECGDLGMLDSPEKRRGHCLSIWDYENHLSPKCLALFTMKGRNTDTNNLAFNKTAFQSIDASVSNDPDSIFDNSLLILCEWIKYRTYRVYIVHSGAVAEIVDHPVDPRIREFNPKTDIHSACFLIDRDLGMWKTLKSVVVDINLKRHQVKFKVGDLSLLHQLIGAVKMSDKSTKSVKNDSKTVIGGKRSWSTWAKLRKKLCLPKYKYENPRMTSIATHAPGLRRSLNKELRKFLTEHPNACIAFNIRLGKFSIITKLRDAETISENEIQKIQLGNPVKE